jgi:hypothetical protein
MVKKVKLILGNNEQSLLNSNIRHDFANKSK